MAKMTVRHECGHTSRVDVGDGTAASKSAIVFEATLQNCPACREAEEAEEDFAVGQNARIEQRAKSSTKTSSTAAEARRNAKAQQVWQSLRHEGQVRGNELMEWFSVASQSQQGVRYQIHHDLVTGNLHCDCVAGQYERECVHKAAVRRYLASRADAINKAADEVVQARWEAAQQERDTAPRRVRSFSFMA